MTSSLLQSHAAGNGAAGDGGAQTIPVQTNSVQTTAEVLQCLRAHRSEWEALGVRDIWVFGSAARGELRPDSDIDLLVELSRPLGLAFFDLAPRFETWLGRPVDLGTRASLHPRAWATAARDLIHATY